MLLLCLCFASEVVVVDAVETAPVGAKWCLLFEKSCTAPGFTFSSSRNNKNFDEDEPEKKGEREKCKEKAAGGERVKLTHTHK